MDRTHRWPPVQLLASSATTPNELTKGASRHVSDDVVASQSLPFSLDSSVTAVRLENRLHWIMHTSLPDPSREDMQPTAIPIIAWRAKCPSKCRSISFKNISFGYRKDRAVGNIKLVSTINHIKLSNHYSPRSFQATLFSFNFLSHLLKWTFSRRICGVNTNLSTFYLKSLS